MKQYGIQQVEQRVVRAIICDKCGTSVDGDDVLEAQEWITVRIDGGFSSIFGDGTQLACDLCQYCVQTLLGVYLRDVKSVE